VGERDRLTEAPLLHVLFTLDYEIHGNGEGSPHRLMLEPTGRMLRQFDRHGAKLSVMADVGEILRFRRHAEETGSDDFAYGAIVEQLRDAVCTGHDVQLHVHPSYFNAELVDGRWQLDYTEYDLAALGPKRIDEIVRTGKAFLEELLRPVDPSYGCLASRSANWSMQPSPDLVGALARNGIRIDTSVFKYGRRDGLVKFDYRDAHSALVPWRVDPADVCRAAPDGEVLEFPIYAENRRLHGFLSANRVHRALLTRRHPVPVGSPRNGNGAAPAVSTLARARRAVGVLAGRHAWKLDFNQCSGRQLIAGLERARRRYDRPDRTLPVILIGHSKLFTRRNERVLEPFLEHVSSHPERFRYATFGDSLESVAG
jgi:hypothetical protein